MNLRRITFSACKFCTQCACTIAVWAIWLVLGGALAVQIHLSFSREFTIPGWLVNRLENRHADIGLRAHFGSATIDPRGHIRVRDARLYGTNFPEPLLTARAIDGSLDFWRLLTGGFLMSKLELRDAELRLPAMLAPSGKAEPILTEGNLTLRMEGRSFTLDRLTARLANLALAARGELTLPPLASRRDREPGELAALLLKTYLQHARTVAARAAALAAFEKPRLELRLAPHPERVAMIHATLTAASFHPPPVKPSALGSLVTGPLTLHAALPLVNKQPWAARVFADTDRLALSAGAPASANSPPPRLLARDVQLSLLAAFSPEWRPSPRSLDLAIGRLTASHVSQLPGGTLSIPHLNARLTGALPRVRGEWSFHLFDDLWTLRTDTDFSTHGGALQLASRLTPAVFTFASQLAKRDLRALLKPAAPPTFELGLHFAPGGNFSTVRGRFFTGPITVHRVALDAAGGEFAYTAHDRRLDVGRILLRAGESEARGGYAMDAATRDFRFLLHGRLRPEAIAGWFSQWWPNFWKNFSFTEVPRADIDIQGRWGTPRTTVFLHADADRAALRDVPFDRVRTTLYIRPDWYQALEFFVTRGAGFARGDFIRHVDLEKDQLRFNAFNAVTADLDLDVAKIFGRTITDIAEPFVFSRPPRLALSGRIDGPAAPGGAHERVRVQVDSSGPFTFFGFPLSDLSTRADVRDDDVRLDDLRVGFAQGGATGGARLQGRGENRRLSFDARLDGASLGESIATLERYGAQRKNQPLPPRSKFQEKTAYGRLNLRLKAEGDYRDLLSFRGDGAGEITGAELAQINLLGGLSEVLRAVRLDFTSLRLDTARADFKLDGRQLEFPDLRITGRSASVELKGLYRLDLFQMDFNARVSPYELSKNPLANVFDVVLTPFTSVLELKLTGSLEQPKWRFTYGPSSILRSLAGKKDNFEETPPEKIPEKSAQP